MPHILEAFIPHIPGSTFHGDSLELRESTDFLYLVSGSLIWVSHGKTQKFRLNGQRDLHKLAIELRAAGIENSLDRDA